MFYLLEDNRIIEELPLQTVIVKNQSENVYDLIDWEKDLVKVDNMIYQCKYFHRDLREEYIENKWFTAIYKPDEKGNYIKVWEVKENGQ